MDCMTCRPFDSELYEDEVEDDDLLDDEGRARLKLKVTRALSLVVKYPHL